MTTLIITRDYGLTYVVVCKLVCSCGWYDKFYEKDALPKAKAHIRSKHETGTIKCGENEMEVMPHEEVRNRDAEGDQVRDNVIPFQPRERRGFPMVRSGGRDDVRMRQGENRRSRGGA